MAPDGLSARGSAFWDALTDSRTWDPAGLILVAEACRIVDRLEQLDQLLRGDLEAWARIVVNYHGSAREIELTLDDALAEARQQQGSLLQLLTKLGLGKSETKLTGQENRVDAFAARRASRIAASAAR